MLRIIPPDIRKFLLRFLFVFQALVNEYFLKYKELKIKRLKLSTLNLFIYLKTIY